VILLAAALAATPTPSPPAPAPSSAAAAPSPGTAGSPGDDARFDSDASLPAHAEDVVDYTLRASLDPAQHTVHGEGAITWRNTSRVAVRELWVHLYLNAFKTPRSVFERAEVGGFRGSAPITHSGSIDVRKLTLRTDDGPIDLWPGAELHRPGDEDETDARVPLPRDLAPGETIHLDVAWDDHLPNIVERTGFEGSFHMVAQWFPKIARLEPDGRWAHFPLYHLGEFYADYGTYDVTLDVPQGFTIGATGPAIDTRVEAGRRVERHVQGDVHDFAWTAWDEWQVEKTVLGGVRVTMLYPPGFRATASRELRAIEFALPWYSEHYGRYPYEVLTVMHAPYGAWEAGGMEYPTFITTRGAWYGPPWIYEIEATAIHELGHQWFYGLVGTNEVEWPFLDEGLTTFTQELAAEEWLGSGSISDLLGLPVSALEGGAALATLTEHDAPIAQPAYAFLSGADYSGLVYLRSGALLETVRRVYGDDVTQRALGRYARKNRFAHPAPDELLRAYRDVAGEGAERALRRGFFEKGWVDFAIGDVRAGTPGAGGAYDASVLVQRRGTLPFPVDVDLVRADGARERVRWDGEGEAVRVPYHGPVPLVGAVVDPDRAVLADDDPTNDFATVRGQGGGAPRTLERVLYWIELAIQAVLP
jgi:hypothetical protein